MGNSRPWPQQQASHRRNWNRDLALFLDRYNGRVILLNDRMLDVQVADAVFQLRQLLQILHIDIIPFIFISPYIRGAYARSYAHTNLDTVHPHTCGAYDTQRYRDTPSSGSSPHTWGIPNVVVDGRTVQRFIPTYVGHTPTAKKFKRWVTVHPHIRGAYFLQG